MNPVAGPRALVVMGSLLIGGLLAMGGVGLIGRGGAFNPSGQGNKTSQDSRVDGGRLPPARPAWVSPLQPSCTIQDLAQRQHLQSLLVSLRTAPQRVRVDPTNFGKRFRRDAFGRAVDPTPRLVVLHETVYGMNSAIQTFRTEDEVIEKANNTPFGLSAGVWTDKGSKIFNMTSKLRAGVVWANTYNKFDPVSPFGGYKESGFGREGGVHGLSAYLK